MTDNPTDVPLGLDEGSELLAVLFSVGLWGITCVQTIFYFIHFSHDTFVLRAMVAWLWLADSVHQLLLVKGVYSELITNFCNYDQVLDVNMQYLWQVLLTALVALPSQLFFVNRIAKFSGKRWLLFALWAPAATLELAGALAFIALGTMTPTSEELVSTAPSSIFTAVQATAATVDISITAGLICLLWRSREDAQYRMRNVIKKLLIISLSTGIWTALFAILIVIAMLVFPNTLIYTGLSFPLCPLYCNAVLVNLNARQVIEKLERRPAHDSVTFLRHTESSGPTEISGRSHGMSYERSLAQTSRCRCMSTNYGHAEAGVQASLDTTKVEQLA